MKNKRIFCNIAEGTHAGHITMVARDDIPQSNLLVKYGENDGEIRICQAKEKPMGVCMDCGETGDLLDVALAGSAESSMICIANCAVQYGDIVYTSEGGKVSTVSVAGSYRVGISLTSSVGGGIIEVDTQGFGGRAYQIIACGEYTWNAGTAKTGTVAVSGMKDGDMIFANLVDINSAETLSMVSRDEETLKFTLDTNGTDGKTKINWMIVRIG